jgi:hypothetical protein
VGKVSNGDSANTSDDNPNDTARAPGAAEYENITDWTTFERPNRGWGRSIAGAFPGTPTRDCCKNGEVCGIWDFNLKQTDTKLRGVVPAPAGGAVVVHVWYGVTTPADCAAIAGAVWNAGCESTFVRGAYEQLEDGAGNDNGLCESNETCIVTPNIGRYQGHGDLVSAGSIGTGATVQNVTLLRHQSNGY